MSISGWIIWAFLLIAQNFAFTFVSRARNSGSLRKHLQAGFFSNGIWFVGQIFAVGAFMSILSGKLGVVKAIGAGLFYTTFTLAGSLLAHKFALKTEKGDSRVGAHKDVAQFTQDEAGLLRSRALFVDTGDGFGALTTEEIVKLKELVGTKVDEIVTFSGEGSLGDFEQYNSPGVERTFTTGQWQPARIDLVPPAQPGQGAKL